MSEKNNDTTGEPKPVETQTTDTAKQEKKATILTFSINLDELNKPQERPTPENERLWGSVDEMSAEYKQLCSLLQIMALYMARQCNEGAEVKDNSCKRLVLIRTLLEVFINNLNITGYGLYGILTDVLHESYMNVSGRRFLDEMFYRLSAEQSQKALQKSKSYMS